MIGRFLGQYQICEKLGEGGMGVVWKARDTHLERFVALKTLPDEKLADPERKRRAVQEARAASALNHPNIVHIYDVAQADGVQFISMEYVPGKTLDQLIGRKGLRLKDALKCAVQIADALAQAHAAGIIHRDLKPSNVIVSENGNVKVLDFGLAKLTELATHDFAETATTRAEDDPSTEEGVVFGTAAYMSPEQAEGKKLDPRSDIFSFGSMLYEMLTGRRAFYGHSKVSILSAILKDEPKPVSALVADAPRDLEKVINRCLRKDPNRRFQHMADVKVALEELKEESESGKLTGVAQTESRTRRSHWTWTIAGVAVLLMTVGIWYLRPKPRPVPKVRPLTTYQGSEIGPAFSPDGKQVAFAWDGEKGDKFRIYVKLVDTGTPLKLTSGPGTDYSPIWSPDGRFIAFYRAQGEHGQIWIVSALGGPARPVGEATRLFGGLSWSPDGKLLAVSEASGEATPLRLYIISLESDERRSLTSPTSASVSDIAPAFSPDGKTLAFIRAPENGSIYFLPVSANGAARSEPRRLVIAKHIAAFDWTPDGRYIVFSSYESASSNLWMIAASGGTPERLIGSENASNVSVSRAGNRLVYERSSFDANIWRIPGPKALDKNSAPTRVIASTATDQEPQFSPDGRKIAFTSARSGKEEIWLCDNDGLNPMQMTSFDAVGVGSPRWSPDSRLIALDSRNEGNWQIFVMSADGGPVRRVTTGPSENVRPSWSRDGSWIYFGSTRSGDWQIWKMPVNGAAAQQITKTGGREAFESPDGKFVFYAKLDSAGIWKVPAGGGQETRVLEHGGQGLWTLTREGIYFLDGSAANPTLKFYSFGTRQSETFKEFPKNTQFDTVSSEFSISPDGESILYTQLDQASTDLMLMENYR
jgi:Tol biopolymer transport system component/serine/threonine protein kinase